MSHPLPVSINFSHKGLIHLLDNAIDTLPDPRKGKNTTYTLRDIVRGAFSVFFMQSPSFLAHQLQMQTTSGQNNAESLFGITHIPTDDQIRTVLDLISPEYLFTVFDMILSQLATVKGFDSHRVSSVSAGQGAGTLLVVLDGTYTCSSEKISCPHCLSRTQRTGEKSGEERISSKDTSVAKTYYHSMITPVVVAPGNPHVIPLPPVFITPQDGDLKQDCEHKAAKRWLTSCAPRYAPYGLTLLGDDLYCHEPTIKHTLQAGCHYVFVCKPDSHTYLTDWVSTLEEGKDKYTHTTRRRASKGTRTGPLHEVVTHTYANDVPLKDGDKSVIVSWCEVTITIQETGKQTYHNSFVTDYHLTHENVEDICLWGRTRWKVENESNNTLKTKGYHLEHNYGHGNQYLANHLATLTLLAFLFHTIHDMQDVLYAKIRQMIGSRATFFNHLKTLTIYWYYENWQALLEFMYQGLTRQGTRNIDPG